MTVFNNVTKKDFGVQTPFMTNHYGWVSDQ